MTNEERQQHIESLESLRGICETEYPNGYVASLTAAIAALEREGRRHPMADNTQPSPDLESLREELANLCHEQWSCWMRYVFEKCVSIPYQSGQVFRSDGTDGTVSIPAWAVERWTRQVNTSYDHLSADEQELDRREADKFLALPALQFLLEMPATCEKWLAMVAENKRLREENAKLKDGLEEVRDEAKVRCLHAYDEIKAGHTPEYYRGAHAACNDMAYHAARLFTAITKADKEGLSQ